MPHSSAISAGSARAKVMFDREKYCFPAENEVEIGKCGLLIKLEAKNENNYNLQYESFLVPPVLLSKVTLRFEERI